MRQTLQNILDRNRILVIDGSMGTALENLGADLNNSLWTARVLADRPELVKQVHLDYFRAGADAGITCSYQASIPGLAANGFTEQEAENLITRSVTIFQEARQEWWDQEGKAAGRAWPLCLAGVGPYGAYLADGSEYRGHYGVSQADLENSIAAGQSFCGRPGPMYCCSRPSPPWKKPWWKPPLPGTWELPSG